MASTDQPVGTARRNLDTGFGREGLSRWTGWIAFAAAILVLLGAFNIIEGLAALLVGDQYFVTGAGGLLIFNLGGWGWIHLAIGAIQAFAGLGLLTGSQLARGVAVLMVVINAVAQLTFIGAAPIWSAIIIAVDVVVLWALIVHGAEARRRIA